MDDEAKRQAKFNRARREALRLALASGAVIATGAEGAAALEIEKRGFAAKGDVAVLRDGFEVASSYLTTFALDENPLVEDGGWWQAGTIAGPNWQNVRVQGGRAFGVGPSANYDDCTACRADFGGDKHRARAVIHRAAGYTAPSTHEVELVVAVNLGPNSVRLYEWLWSIHGGLQIVRWNGLPSDFTLDLPVSGPGVGVPRDGDVMELRYDASSGNQVVLNCYANDVLVATAIDDTPGRILSGHPGLSFFARSGSGLNMASYCFSEWSCALG